MKNLILLFALVFGLSVNANPIKDTTKNASVEKNTSKIEANKMNLDIVYSTSVNTFCKLITTGNYDAVKSMIKAGIDINEKSVGMTPLMYAARYNRVDIVNLLIANGADLKAKSNKGYTALKYAKISKAHDTYKIIEAALKAQKDKKKARKNSK
ncbi:ankyrin repeat domain-containing protein [Aureibaculum sp. 2210JD6-5]|uniref:ankyrin repeat domain-containing protein n=1 Tax=Aureibaculum sp. 2210JD6-5 TaxID=3103957 RepID=UPI002AADAA0F|nr:ankyrin repeat domain-containing protein [Aureibaculum sp. 2210JD6-5]MDY7395960.1 ankyrin repeat domain-containing protein [Aureibaculum sp. 2210JD6-5]